MYYNAKTGKLQKTSPRVRHRNPNPAKTLEWYQGKNIDARTYCPTEEEIYGKPIEIAPGVFERQGGLVHELQAKWSPEDWENKKCAAYRATRPVLCESKRPATARGVRFDS